MADVSARQQAVSDALHRRESTLFDEQIMRQLLKTWPLSMPPGYASNVPFYQKNAKERMKDFEDANPDLHTRSFRDKTVVEYRRLKAIRAILYFQTHPINRLPTEILVNIFRLVAWGTVDPSAGVALRLKMTWVCRTWRSLLLSDKTLWSAIWFRDPPPYERSFAWFERAGEAPISIRINERTPVAEPTDSMELLEEEEDPSTYMTAEEVSELLAKVFTKFSQIDVFIVILKGAEAIMAVLEKLNEVTRNGAAVRMRRFELHRPSEDPLAMEDMDRLPLFGGAPTPLLNFVAIHGVTLDWNNTTFSNLTTLDLRKLHLDIAPTTAQFHDILSSCPNLHKLVLEGAGPLPALPDAYPPVFMPTLHTLVIGDFSREFLNYILGLFSAPHVRDLTLMNLSGESYRSVFQHIVESKSLKEIKILTLYNVSVDTDYDTTLILRKWFQSMPDIQYLRVAMASEFLHILTLPGILPKGADPKSKPPTLCPRLDVLEFQHTNVHDIANWVRGRRESGVPPQSLYVNSKFVHYAKDQINNVLRPLGVPLLVAPLGNTTPDELRIIKEDELLEDI